MKDDRIRQYIYVYNVCDVDGIVLSKKDIQNLYLKTLKINKDEQIKHETDERVIVERVTTRIVKILGRQGDIFN